MIRLITSLLLSILLLISSATAGSFFGPGPWANGAYYPGQLDGKYSATVFGNNTSGVLGFAQRAGSPTIVTNSSANLTNSIVQNTVIPDPWQNYFLIFFNGVTYYGTTFATINISSKQVTGALFNGRSSATSATLAGGGFTAVLTSDKSPITFLGDNTGQFSVGGAGTISRFSLNGIKVSDITDSSFGSTPVQ
jgi:hypothetical protein